MAHAPMPPAMALWPAGTHGIAYDIFTNATEADLPLGWHARRGNILFIYIFIFDSLIIIIY
jgi:hypothetical protein